MQKPLPQKSFSWMTPDELDDIHPLLYNENSQYGYILEVSLILI